MTVGELIKLLQGFDPEDKVGFAYPAGDYWSTTIVKTITEVQEDAVKYSGYWENNIISKNPEIANDDDMVDDDMMIVLR